MKMQRTAPRDLFNDGNLLTNYGHLYICLEKEGLEEHMRHYKKEEQFEIVHNICGDTYVANVRIVDTEGESIEIHRPCNSREKYSLYFTDSDEEEYEVFTECDDGSCALSKEFINRIAKDK